MRSAICCSCAWCRFPFWLVNLAPALVGVRLSTFVAATAIGILPATIAFAVFGAGLGSVIAAQETQYNACLAAGGARLRGPLRAVAGADADAASARCWRWRCSRSFPPWRGACGGASSAPARRPTGCDDGRAAHPRSLRHRRRRRRSFFRGGGGRAGHAGGADRKRPDGRRMPQHRLRAVESDDCRRPPRRCVSHQRAVRHRGCRSGDRLRRGQRPHPPRHRHDRAQRFQGALHRARRPRDRRRSALYRHPDRRGGLRTWRHVRDQGAPLRHRDRIAAGGAGHSRTRSACPT